MPSDELPKPNSKYEMTQADMEKILAVEPDPSTSAQELIEAITANNYAYLRYIVTPEWNIVLSPHQHNELVKIVGVERDDCLVSDADLRYDQNDKYLEFVYNWWIAEKVPYIRDASEQKIKEYFNKKGLQIAGIKYVKPDPKPF